MTSSLSEPASTTITGPLCAAREYCVRDKDEKNWFRGGNKSLPCPEFKYSAIERFADMKHRVKVEYSPDDWGNGFIDSYKYSVNRGNKSVLTSDGRHCDTKRFCVYDFNKDEYLLSRKPYIPCPTGDNWRDEYHHDTGHAMVEYPTQKTDPLSVNKSSTNGPDAWIPGPGVWIPVLAFLLFAFFVVPVLIVLARKLRKRIRMGISEYHHQEMAISETSESPV